MIDIDLIEAQKGIKSIGVIVFNSDIQKLNNSCNIDAGLSDLDLFGVSLGHPIFKEELENHFDVKWSYFWNNQYATKYMHNKKKYVILIALQYILASLKRIFQLLFLAPKADVVFIQKACIPKMKFTFLSRVKAKGAKIVFDIDDATYLFSGDNTDEIAKLSDVVVCGNNNLKEHYEALKCKCMLIPTVEYTPKYEKYWQDTFNNKVIGWIGSASSVHNLELVVEAINTLVEKHPEVKFEIICNDDQGFVNKIENSKLIIWDKEKYVEDMSKFTIGIMPLKDTEFNRGKCGFKLIQYLNMRKPVVGSNVGVNGEIVEGNGITANTVKEWVEALEELLYNKNHYDKCVRHIDKVFFETYHFSKASERLIDIING